MDWIILILKIIFGVVLMAAGVILINYGLKLWNRRAKPQRRRRVSSKPQQQQQIQSTPPIQPVAPILPKPSTSETTPPPEQTTPPPPPPPPPFLLAINDAADMREYIGKMKDISSIEDYLDTLEGETNWCRAALNKLNKTLSKKEAEMLSYFEENEKGLPAEEIISVEENLISPLQTCYSSREKYQGLIDVIENYLEGLKIVKALNPSTGKEFKPGDNYDDWVELNLNIMPIPQKTNEREKHNTIAKVALPPYSLHYINEEDEEATTYLGGQCIVYSYQEGDSQ